MLFTFILESPSVYADENENPDKLLEEKGILLRHFRIAFNGNNTFKEYLFREDEANSYFGWHSFTVLTQFEGNIKSGLQFSEALRFFAQLHDYKILEEIQE